MQVQTQTLILGNPSAKESVMMKTCSLCGLQYQTMAEKGYRYCHQCAVKVISQTIGFLLPILFELTKGQLHTLSQNIVYANNLIMNELDRRDKYYANMLEQRKPQ
jgi:hypothetical protein